MSAAGCATCCANTFQNIITVHCILQYAEVSNCVVTMGRTLMRNTRGKIIHRKSLNNINAYQHNTVPVIRAQLQFKMNLSRRSVTDSGFACIFF